MYPEGPGRATLCGSECPQAGGRVAADARPGFGAGAGRWDFAVGRTQRFLRDGAGASAAAPAVFPGEGVGLAEVSRSTGLRRQRGESGVLRAPTAAALELLPVRREGGME